jgi:hypothetical protein
MRVENGVLQELMDSDIGMDGHFSIPEGVTTIASNAFKYCAHRLIALTLPKRRINIDGYAFSHCSQLTMLILPQGLAGISEFSFRNCRSLTTIIIEAENEKEYELVLKRLHPKLRPKALSFAECSQVREIQQRYLNNPICQPWFPLKREQTTYFPRLPNELQANVSGYLNYKNPLYNKVKNILLKTCKCYDKDGHFDMEAYKSMVKENFTRIVLEHKRQVAKKKFLTKHSQLFTEAKLGFFGMFRNTRLNPAWDLKTIIKHGMAYPNRTRLVCIQMGWLTKLGKLSDTADDYVKLMFGEMNINQSQYNL